MKASIFLVLLAGLAILGCNKQTTETGKPPADSGNPLDAPAQYGGALIQGQRKAVITADVASISQAIKMFYTTEGRYPKDLKEIVSPDYLPKLPEPPRGMKFDYNPKTGEVKVVKQ